MEHQQRHVCVSWAWYFGLRSQLGDCAMTPTTLVGYFAASLVFATFCTKRMMPLRALAIASNIAFIGYACLGELLPILILHTAMLPLNIYRLRQEMLLKRPGPKPSSSHIHRGIRVSPGISPARARRSVARASGRSGYISSRYRPSRRAGELGAI